MNSKKLNQYIALANSLDPKIRQFIDLEEARFTLDEEKGYSLARFSIIGISTFGENIINRFQKYAYEVQEDLRYITLNISNENEIRYLPKTFCERSDAILIVAQKGQFSTNAISKIINSIGGEGQLVIGFFDGFEQHDFGKKLTNIVNYTGDVELFYHALRLLPDIAGIRSPIGVDFADIRTVLTREKSFHITIKEVTNGKIDLSDIDLSKSESILFDVYGDNQIEMATFDSVTSQITDHANSDTIIVCGISGDELSGTKTRVVMLY